MNSALLHAWHETVARAPDAPAVCDASAGRVWTRCQLDERARAWSATHGGELAGATVVFAEANGAEWFTVFLGLLHSDAVMVALDPGEPVAARHAIATAIGAGGLWTGNALVAMRPKRRRAQDGRRLLKLTSGSTGSPRPVPFTEAQLMADGRQVCASMQISAEDVNLGVIPFGHSYGLGNLVLPLLLQGTAVIAGVAILPHALAEAAGRWRPTVFPAVPPLLRAMTLAGVDPEAWRSLRTVISAGAPLATEVAQAFHAKFGRPVHSFYGTSETGGITFDRTGEAALAGRSVGTPLEGVTLRFERAGRFSVESAAVFTLGNRRRGRTGQGVYRPGDVAELNDRGELVLLGRSKGFVKIAGRRVNLTEVELALKRLSGVRDALVVADASRGDALAAAVATDQPGEALRASLRESLAAWKVPKKIVTLPAFPVTARGKTDAARLRQLLAGG